MRKNGEWTTEMYATLIEEILHVFSDIKLMLLSFFLIFVVIVYYLLVNELLLLNLRNIYYENFSIKFHKIFRIFRIIFRIIF